jgi:hypothetical protein
MRIAYHPAFASVRGDFIHLLEIGKEPNFLRKRGNSDNLIMRDCFFENIGDSLKKQKIDKGMVSKINLQVT